ncbi:MAG: polyprenyl diphosphate synthase [Opitutales bacterium]
MSVDPAALKRPPPTHVAVIMDGNGRWAQRQGLRREEGHREGVRNVERILKASRDLEVRYLTLYAFSVENWKRPRLEVEALMRLLESFLKEQRSQLQRHGIRLRVFGRLEEMPRSIRKLLHETIEETAHFEQWNLSLCLNYGARTEIVDAVQRYTAAVLRGDEPAGPLDYSTLARFLYTADVPDPDLVIRTSGETRVSNFLLLQSAYAEYCFMEKFWPEFTHADLASAIAAYRCRERRFGLTGEQIREAREPVSKI